MKIKEIVRRIEAYHPYLPGYEGCDGYKAGDPENECTGVACALVPTYDVVKRTIEQGCNFLYVHEPSYYMTPDYPEWRGDFPNQVYEEKRKLIDDHHLTIYRDHDHTHAHQPDGIFTGVIKYFGWEKYLVTNEESVPYGYTFEIPEMTVAEINHHLMNCIGMHGARYIGNPDQKIHRIAIVGHLFPGGFGETKEENGFFTDYSTEIIRHMETRGLQAIIPGEVIEWNVLSYIHDGVAMGKPMACFNIGHFNFEELGAKYAADWIGDLVQGKVPVTYIPTGDIWSFA
ncbi:MAG: Nif3-like dinuclear metal center hexameric protein [Blautia sp.]|nr:Nif3-like dinuclear metal center hexameric protein [Blautia sp.]